MLLRQMAAAIDVDTAILSKIERGERKARRELVEKIAKALGFDKKELVIEYLSENIAYGIIDEETAMDVLRVAEGKVRYFKLNR